jgi:hypothetical protein
VSEDPATDALRRWIASGGHWEVLATDGDRVTVGLLTCDGGEVVGVDEMDRVTMPVEALPSR